MFTLYTRKTALIAIITGSLFLILPAAQAQDTDPGYIPPATRPVDLVICLDTSGSMTALIDSARAKLWEIVNQLSVVKPVPKLRIGLLTYGTPGLSSEAKGWVVRQIDLTSDLDTVYAKMMAMNTSGGDEFVGWVLNDALNTMSWSEDPRALRIIFVAGNESADQAHEKFNFRNVAKEARGKDIIINAIYAGNHQQGIAESWGEVAMHGHGSFSAIDMQQGTLQIATPQDEILIKLNIELNKTYLPFGEKAEYGSSNQLAQDGNAARMGKQSQASRVVSKGNSLYGNAIWDLVDASQEKDFDWDELEEKELPEVMRSMTDEEKKAYLNGMIEARKAIQKKITEVGKAREEYLKQERSKMSGKTSLDDAILQALRKQAEGKGFTFENN